MFVGSVNGWEWNPFDGTSSNMKVDDIVRQADYKRAYLALSMQLCIPTYAER